MFIVKRISNSSADVSSYSIVKIFKYAIDNGLNPHVLSNEGDEEWDLIKQPIVQALMCDECWVHVDLWVKFVRKICEFFEIDQVELGYRVNLNSDFDNIQVGLIRTLPISILTKIITRHTSDSVNKNLITYLSEFDVKNKRMVVEFAARNVLHYTRDVCDFNRGAVTAILEWKGYREIESREETCIVKGDCQCKVVFTWRDKVKVAYFKRLRDFVGVFLKSQNKIPDYVWKELQVKIPQAPDDLKDLDFED